MWFRVVLTVCLFFKPLVPSLTYVNCEGPYDNAFAQSGVITRRRKKFVEIVAVAECYLIITHVKI